MNLAPPPGRSRIRDWVGLRVRSLRPLRNAALELPEGTEYVVHHVGRRGLHLSSARCPCCGVVQHLDAVNPEDIVALADQAVQLPLGGLGIDEHPRAGLSGRLVTLAGSDTGGLRAVVDAPSESLHAASASLVGRSVVIIPLPN